jgi:cytochrome c-type biogenesis protein CcmH/NrfG
MAYYSANKVNEATKVFRHAVEKDPEDRRAQSMYEMLTEVPGV